MSLQTCIHRHDSCTANIYAYREWLKENRKHRVSTNSLVLRGVNLLSSEQGDEKKKEAPGKKERELHVFLATTYQLYLWFKKLLSRSTHEPASVERDAQSVHCHESNA